MGLAEWEKKFQHYLEIHFSQDDKAHDLAHFHRVWQSARKIMQLAEADELVVLTACYFHDVVNLPKNHPERHLASSQAAEKTLLILAEYFPEFPRDKYQPIAHAIAAHSFSAGITPLTIEAKIVQDADRLESLGAIGLARVFHVSGQLGRGLFDPVDPLALHRPLDDLKYTFDHFQTKLLTLANSMQTEMGKEMAQFNIDYLIQFMSKLCAELKGEYYQFDEATLARFRANNKPL